MKKNLHLSVISGIAIGLTSTLVSASPANAIGFAIDGFDVGPSNTTVLGGFTGSTTFSNAAIYGGRRDISIDNTTSVGASTTRVNTGASFLNIQAFAPGSSMDPVTTLFAQLIYNLANPTTTALNSGTPLLGPQRDRFFITILQTNDLQPGSFISIRAQDTAGGDFTQTALAGTDFNASTSVDQDLTNNFAFTSFTGVDFANISRVTIGINLITNDVDPASITIDQFAVPFEFTPATGLMALGAFWGASVAYKRRKQLVSKFFTKSQAEATK